MAKLKKVSIYIEALSLAVDAHSYYSDGTFFVPVPPDTEDYAKKLLGESQTGKKSADKRENGLSTWYKSGKWYVACVGKDEEDAVKNWKAYVTTFYSEQQVEDQVLLFRMSFSSLGVGGGRGSRYHFDSGESDGASFKRLKVKRERHNFEDSGSAAQISFDWIQAKRKTIGKTVTLYWIDDAGRESRVGARHGSDWKVIPYSPEAEKFLSDIYAGLETIMEKLSKFAGTPDRVIKAVESQQKLLA